MPVEAPVAEAFERIGQFVGGLGIEKRVSTAGGCRYFGNAGAEGLDMPDELRERLAIRGRLARRQQVVDERPS